MVKLIRFCLGKTSSLRENRGSSFFVIDTALHKSVSVKTSVGWVVKTSEKCRINKQGNLQGTLNIFSNNIFSTLQRTFLIQIAQVAGWTSFSTFVKIFDKSVNDINIGLNILNSAYNTLYSIL